MQRNGEACKGTEAAKLDVLNISVGGNMYMRKNVYLYRYNRYRNVHSRFS